MKLFKKTAALLFCLALVFSVMAISASATDDESPTFTLTADQVSGYTDHDDITGIEVSKTGTLTYDLKLKSNSATALAVNAFSFKIMDTAGVTPAVTFYNAGDTSSAAVPALKTNYPLTGPRTGYIYSFSSETSPSNDFSVANTEVTIGQLSFTFGDDANHQTIQPTLSDINLTLRVENDYNHNKIDVVQVPIDIQVNPIYTITLNKFTLGDDGLADTTTGALPTDSNGYATNDTDTLYYTFDGGAIYSDSAATTASSLNKAPEIVAYGYASSYTDDGWKVTSVISNTNSGWANNAALSSSQSISGLAINSLPVQTVNAQSVSKLVGNVTLTPQYSPISYHVTYKYNDALYPNTADKTDVTYTIEAPVTIIDNPSWVGYNFMGWSATHDTTTDANNTRGYGAIWTAYADTDYDATHETENAKLITTSTSLINKVYGDVILTAVWDEAGAFKTAKYGYANSGDVIALYIVKTTSNYAAADTYKFKNNNMFIVSDKYIQSFTADELPDSLTLASLENDYVIYAYITSAGTGQGETAPKKNDVSITKANPDDSSATTSNVPIAYDGDVYREAGLTKINTADYGNVDALLAASGGTVRASELTADTMRARLEADVVRVGDKVNDNDVAARGDNDNTNANEKDYASIWDIKAIISKLN